MASDSVGILDLGVVRFWKISKSAKFVLSIKDPWFTNANNFPWDSEDHKQLLEAYGFRPHDFIIHLNGCLIRAIITSLIKNTQI